MKSNEADLARQIIGDIRSHSTRPVRLMEFCGGHTVAILKHGLRQLLPSTVKLFSGPGCPVCVTATGDLDKIIALAKLPGVIIASFGDLLRVPGSYSSLQQARAEGADVRIVYSALEALDLARLYPAKKVVMVGIGFETTAPTIAASVLQAQEEGLRNYLVFSFHKLTPPVMKAILDAGEAHINGIICPGHVSAIIGSRPYEFIPRDYGIACVVAGFEPVDILLTVDMLVNQIESGRPKVEIAYRRAVRPEGNARALETLDRVFAVTAADWRGIGVVAQSGLKLKPVFSAFDAERTFKLEVPQVREPAGCLCGEILRGLKTPADCRLFKQTCTPEHPVGPCMVSAEGACSAYNLYGE
ncbi:MAG TPA: hydrogenase formation protein HypD [Dehalococcoidales bacterium]